MKRRYAVQYGDTITVFKGRLEDAIAYSHARPGSALVYKAHGKWGGNAKRSTRWLPAPMTPQDLAGAVTSLRSSGEVIEAEAAPAGEV